MKQGFRVAGSVGLGLVVLASGCSTALGGSVTARAVCLDEGESSEEFDAAFARAQQARRDGTTREQALAEIDAECEDAGELFDSLDECRTCVTAIIDEVWPQG